MSKIAVLAAVVVGACAALAATGFKGRKTVVGIDLGTTYSVIGINEGSKVAIIPGGDGSPLLPSVVSFLESGKIVVGRDAVELLESRPASTIYGAKRFIGRGQPPIIHLIALAFRLGLDHSFEDTAVSEEAAEHEFQLVQTDNDLSEAWFELKCSGHPPAVSPQRVGSHVIRELLRRAANYLGHSQVSKAVIAVPAKFDARQRAATVEAFRLAGLQVIRTLEEPTAAALAFGLHRKPNVNHILVYDMGGGTLDVSVLFVNDGSVEVLGSDGDDYLGGSDFDQCVTHVLERKLGDKVVALEAAEQAVFCGFPSPTCARHNLYQLSESIRRVLTDGREASTECMALSGEGLGNSQQKYLRLQEATRISSGAGDRGGLNQESNISGPSEGLAGHSCGEWEPISLDLTRSEYERECIALFERGVDPVTRLLDRLDLTVDDIDEVVMVGGMTRTPLVRELLRTHLGVDRLNVEIDPDVVVAYGAATIAH